MGQSTSLPSASPELTRNHSLSISLTTTTTTTQSPSSKPEREAEPTLSDPTSDLPDECLSHIFSSLPPSDRKTCSLVCKRWLSIEGQTRFRLSLNANSDISTHLPSLLPRFDSVTKLALRCDRRSISIQDHDLLLISLHCKNLTHLKIRGCREITDVGIKTFAQNCGSLKKLSCGSCLFGSKGLNAVLENCFLLEEISIKRLGGINGNDIGKGEGEPIGPGFAANSLKTICLKELYNGQLFGPLIIGSKNLKTLKLIKCLGEWDRVLETMSKSNVNGDGLVEVHLERIHVTDFGISAIAKHGRLEVLHLVKTPECTDVGIVSMAEQCKLLRKVHIDGWRTNKIGDEGLISLGKNCGNLQELVLIGINPTTSSLDVIASNCRNLERLAFCSSETIGDSEISCIATKCLALTKFCIRSCPISDNGLGSFASGCPNLVKIKVKKCRDVTKEGVEWLREQRECLVVNLDVDQIEAVDEEDGGEFQTGDTEFTSNQALSRSNNDRGGSLFRAKFRFLFGRNGASSALRRLSNGGGNGVI